MLAPQQVPSLSGLSSELPALAELLESQYHVSVIVAADRCHQLVKELRTILECRADGCEAPPCEARRLGHAPLEAQEAAWQKIYR